MEMGVLGKCVDTYTCSVRACLKCLYLNQTYFFVSQPNMMNFLIVTSRIRPVSNRYDNLTISGCYKF